MKRYFFILASIMLTVFGLVICQFIIKPLLAAFIAALLLKPLSTQLEKMRLPRAVSAMLAMLLMVSAWISLSFLLFLQIKNITADIESLESSFNVIIDKLQHWTSENFGITPSDQIAYLKRSSTSLLRNSTTFLQNAVSATTDFFAEFFLFIISVFFLLYYRSFLTSFLFKCFDPTHHHRVQTILQSTQKMVRRYVLGLFLVILTTAILNIAGLWALGLKHAVFFGISAGILTIIPYIGIIIGSLLPILFAIATTNSAWYPVGVLLIFVSVQFLEGNFITPNVIGNRISLNPFAALLVLFFSGSFFGFLGIILSLPLLATAKIILDNIDSMKPLGYILGNPPRAKSPLFKMRISPFLKSFGISKRP